jgi:hypothetical protein
LRKISIFAKIKNKTMKSMKPFLHVLLLAVFSMTMTHCSKEKRTEHSVYKKSGEWTITSVSWEKVLVDTSGEHVGIGTTANAGTFTFNKDGSGSYNFTIDGTNYSQNFTWSVSGTTINVTKISQTVSLSGIDQFVIAISGTKSDKHSFTVQGTETHQYAGGTIEQSVLTGTFTLSNK